MLSSLLVTLLVGTPPEVVERPAFLFHMEADGHNLQAERYRPRSGDIVLFDDHHPWQRKLYRCCGTSVPLHVGIVFRKPDDGWAVLEAGPEAVQKVIVFDLDQRLHRFDGTVLVRRLKTPLSDEQSIPLERRFKLTDLEVVDVGTRKDRETLRGGRNSVFEIVKNAGGLFLEICLFGRVVVISLRALFQLFTNEGHEISLPVFVDARVEIETHKRAGDQLGLHKLIDQSFSIAGGFDRFVGGIFGFIWHNYVSSSQRVRTRMYSYRTSGEVVCLVTEQNSLAY
jgi:hypothetical protein